MNKGNLYSTIAALAMFSVAGSAIASNGTINFNGTVADATCTVTGLTQTVSFEPALVSVLQPLGAAKVGGQAPAEINLSDCPPNYSNGRLNINWTAAGTKPNRLNLGSTEMRGVAVIMMNQVKSFGSETGGSVISPNATLNIPLAAGSGSITLYPSLYRITEPGHENVTAGTFSTAAQFTLTYN